MGPVPSVTVAQERATAVPLVLLAVAMAAEAGGSACVYSTISLTLSAAGMPIAEVALTFTTIALVGGLGAIAAAALVFALSPRVIAAIGMGIAAIGSVWVFSSSSPAAPFYLASFGMGVFRPCPWVAAASLLTRDEDVVHLESNSRHWARIAAYFAIANALSFTVADVLSYFVFRLRAAHDIAAWSPNYAIASACFVSAALACGASMFDLGPKREVLRREAVSSYRTAAPPATTSAVAELRTNPNYMPALVVLAAIVALEIVSQWMGSPALHGVVSDWNYLSEATRILGVAVLAALSLALPRRSPLFLGGAALVVYALGEVVLSWSYDRGSVALSMAGTCISAPGSAVIGTVLMVYLVLVTRGRSNVAVLAAWQVSVTLLLTGASAISAYRVRMETTVLEMAALMLALMGVVAVVRGDAIHRRCFRPIEPAMPKPRKGPDDLGA